MVLHSSGSVSLLRQDYVLIESELGMVRQQSRIGSQLTDNTLCDCSQ